jgi:hypothetical protein
MTGRAYLSGYPGDEPYETAVTPTEAPHVLHKLGFGDAHISKTVNQDLCPSCILKLVFKS